MPEDQRFNQPGAGPNQPEADPRFTQTGADPRQPGADPRPDPRPFTPGGAGPSRTRDEEDRARTQPPQEEDARVVTARAAVVAAEKVVADERVAKGKTEAEARSRKSNPIGFVGIRLEGDVVDYIKNPNERNERQLLIGKTRYEHTHEDGEGVWIYRNLDPRPR